MGQGPDFENHWPKGMIFFSISKQNLFSMSTPDCFPGPAFNISYSRGNELQVKSNQTTQASPVGFWSYLTLQKASCPS